jgi:flagellar hook-associated protein 1 FlgK
MSNLLNSLLSSANALSAYDQVLQVTQNNVANASTPGFVKHRQSLLSMPFEPASGLNGGVRAGEVESARSTYADQAVRRQIVLLGQAQQDVQSLTGIQSVFDISGDSGLPKALDDLFSSFSAWGQSPNDTVARQTVIERATDVATAFQQTAGNLAQAQQDTEHAVAETVDSINTLSTKLQTLNKLASQGSRADSGLDAQIHSTLEDLAQYVSFTAIEQDDGEVSVLLNSQTPLVVGDQQYALHIQFRQPESPAPLYPGAPGSLRLLASDGSDITDQTTTGQLGALLDARNRVLPSYLGDAGQQGDLNRMAEQFASRVNQLLTSGNVSDGPPPQTGVPLFTYDAGTTNAARSMTVDPTTIKPELLAAIQPGPPYVSNGVPLALSSLASPRNSADEIDGASFNQFYGRLAAGVGSALDDANSRLAVQQSAVAQSKNLRDQMSGVSLDEEASILIQFQRAYEANSRLISVLDQLTEDAIKILQT